MKHISIEQLLRVQDVDSQIIFLEDAKRIRPQELNEERLKVDQAQEGVDDA